MQSSAWVLSSKVLHLIMIMFVQKYLKVLQLFHYHLVCRLCGAIEDIMPDGMDGVEKELESKLTDRITGASVSFTGYCEKCASQTEKDAQVS